MVSNFFIVYLTINFKGSYDFFESKIKLIFNEWKRVIFVEYPS